MTTLAVAGTRVNGPAPLMCWLGRCEYLPTWRAMSDYTDRRGPDSADQLWALEHAPVYTLGRAGRREHVHAIGAVPLVESDRGGQVTYHGPGQLVVYALVDLRRAGLSVRDLVQGLEQAIIEVLARRAIEAQRRPGAPGVYVAGAKVAALGLRIRRGCSLHGLSLNVDMTLAPFAAIDPCGYPALPVTQLRDLGVRATPRGLAAELCTSVAACLGLRRPAPMLADAEWVDAALTADAAQPRGVLAAKS